jgi:hypothetical protein
VLAYADAIAPLMIGVVLCVLRNYSAHRSSNISCAPIGEHYRMSERC